MSTYELVQKMIAASKRTNTLDADSISKKLDVFLLAGRVTEAQYEILLALLEA